MQYRDLGRTGLKVSAVGVGCMMFGWRTGQTEANAIVSSAMDEGINVFDTSVSYGRGESERILGLALKASGRRHDVVIATKCGQASEANPSVNAVGNSRHNVIRQCELSLRRLGVDHIDVLQVHRPSPNIPIEETLGALDQLVREGKVRYVGTSNFAAWQIVEGLWRCESKRLQSVSTEQLRYNLLDRTAEDSVFEVAARYNIGIMTYSPLAEGLLTGKYQRGEPFPDDSRFRQSTASDQYAKNLSPAVAERLDAIRAISSSLGISMISLAVAWVLQNARVSTVLTGPSRRQQLTEIVEAPNIVLGPDILAAIDLICPPGAALLS